MKKILMVTDGSPTTAIVAAQSLREAGWEVVLAAPNMDPAVLSVDGVSGVTINPASAIGRGHLGDLMRQQGPFDAALQWLDPVPAGDGDFVGTGLDHDLRVLDAHLAVHLMLAKGLLGHPDAVLLSVRVLAADGDEPRQSALAAGIDGFLDSFDLALTSQSPILLRRVALTEDALTAALPGLLSP